jgi:hypothetical protein
MMSGFGAKCRSMILARNDTGIRLSVLPEVGGIVITRSAASLGMGGILPVDLFVMRDIHGTSRQRESARYHRHRSH